MLNLMNSIQMSTYLAHCCASNNIQYAQVVPPEAEKHTSHTFAMAYHLPERIPSVHLPRINVNTLCNCALPAYP